MIDPLLYFGYHPTCSKSGLWDSLVDVVHTESNTGDYQTLLQQGKEALQKAINAELSSIVGNPTHIVPISAGLDSRMVLAELINHPDIAKEEITTISFGTPGTWDYEIGQQVADTTGVENIALDLTSDSFDWSESSLRDYAKTQSCPTRLIEGYVNYCVNEISGKHSVIWSGYLGDPSVGAHQPKNPARKWGNACNHFINTNKFTSKLSSPSFDPVSLLPDQPYLKQEKLTYEEQLDFAHRQSCFIKPLVISDEERYLTPFTQPEWLKFSLNLPAEHRQERSLFVDLVSQKYPRIFSIPTDMKRGLPLDTSPLRMLIQRTRISATSRVANYLGLEYTHPNTNYLDFEKALREDGQFRKMAKSLFNHFEKRNERPVQRFWDEHQAGKDRSNEIRAICSAELYLSES